jgi:aminoglycoside 2''-phosphotransferase
LWRDTFQKIDQEDVLGALADQLASFLKALHTVPAGQVIGRELPRYETQREYQDMFARVQKKLFGFMRPEAQRWATSHFETFLGTTSNFSYSPVLRHGDFGTSNLLFEAGKQRITGVIDFSSSGLGDPAVDFAGLLSSYGEAFLWRCMRSYPQLEDFLPRVHFYQGVFALEEALFGIENDDPEAFKAGIAQYI